MNGPAAASTTRTAPCPTTEAASRTAAINTFDLIASRSERGQPDVHRVGDADQARRAAIDVSPLRVGGRADEAGQVAAGSEYGPALAIPKPFVVVFTVIGQAKLNGSHQKQPGPIPNPVVHTKSSAKIADVPGGAPLNRNTRFFPPTMGSLVVMTGNGLHELPQRPGINTGSPENDAPNAKPADAGGLHAMVGFGYTEGYRNWPSVTQ